MMAEPFQRLDEIRPTRHNLYDGSGYVDPPLRAGRSRTGRRPCPQSGPLWWPPNSEPAYPRSKLGQFEVWTRTVELNLVQPLKAIRWSIHQGRQLHLGIAFQ